MVKAIPVVEEDTNPYVPQCCISARKWTQERNNLIMRVK